jgi:hypothetical protein
VSARNYVDPWTSPLDLDPGDRALNPGGWEMEWDGHHGVPVCRTCDVAMTEHTERGFRCCPLCGGTVVKLAEVAS